MGAAQIIVTLFVAAIAIGAFVQISNNPGQANAAASAGADTFVGVVHAFEGRG